MLESLLLILTYTSFEYLYLRIQKVIIIRFLKIIFEKNYGLIDIIGVNAITHECIWIDIRLPLWNFNVT